MEKEKIKILMHMLGMRRITEQENWVQCSCPFSEWTHDKGKDSHPSFGISVGENSIYNCFACHRKGRLIDLPVKIQQITRKDCSKAISFAYGNETMIDAKDKEIPKKELCYVSELVLSEFAPLNRPILNITMDSIRQWGLMFDEEEQRIVFPVRDMEGRLIGMRGRSLDPECKLKFRIYNEYTKSGAFKSHGIWYGMHFPLVPHKKLILVEGERDAILLKQAGIHNVWSSMGAGLTQKQVEKAVDSGYELLLYFDNDSGGSQAIQYFKEKAKKKDFIVVNEFFNTKDPAEAVEKGLAIKILNETIKRSRSTK